MHCYNVTLTLFILLSVSSVQRCVSQTVTAVATTTTGSLMSTAIKPNDTSTLSSITTNVGLATSIQDTTDSQTETTIMGSGGEETTAISFSGNETTFYVTTFSAITGTASIMDITNGIGVATNSMFDEGSGTDVTTIGTGSGFGTTGVPSNTTEIGSGVTTSDFGSGATTNDIGSGVTTSDVGSGFTEEDTTTELTTFFTTPILSNASMEDTTVFNITTGIIPTATTTDFPWYYSVIICLGIIILLLLIFFIKFCCLYKKSASHDIKAAPAEHIKSVDNIKLHPTAAYVPQAKTIRPEPKQEVKSISSFISEKPMAPPAYIQDTSASVRKRDKVRPRVKSSVSTGSFDDEGFIEPLLVKPRRKQPQTARKMPSTIQRTPQPEHYEEEMLIERKPTSYQPYYLPMPVQTALTSKALGDTLTNDAMEKRHALQRSEIERHKNKQRLRNRNSRFLRESYRKDQFDIDTVLEPPPPAVLQPSSKTRKQHHKKHGNAMYIDGRGARDQLHDTRMVIDDKAGKYKSLKSDTDDSENSTQKKISSHEATISKMAKLLEEAYALLVPAVQKNLVRPIAPLPTTPYTAQRPPAPPPSGYIQQSVASVAQNPFHTIPQYQTQPSEMLFTRTHTPPALLPQNNPPASFTRPEYTTLSSDRSNDSRSIVWTPYRTYDQLAQIQAEDQSFKRQSTMPIQDTLSSDPSRTINNLPNHPNSSSDTYMDGGTEPTASIVQSIKDTLSKLAGSSTPVQEIYDPETLR